MIRRLCKNLIKFLEAEGVDVNYLESTFHFNRELANQFFGTTQLKEKTGKAVIEWKNNDNTFVNIPLADAYLMCEDALTQFMQIHIDNM